ncbi:hypothetical protein ACFLTJ_01910 [Chloroflexota bacterium]
MGEQPVAVVGNINLCLKVEEVLHHRGLSCGPELELEVKDIVQGLMIRIDDLLEPVFIYETYSIASTRNNLISLENGTRFSSSTLAKFLNKATQLAVVVCTIGPRLEERVAEYFGQMERLKGLILDHIGTMALESLTAVACQVIEEIASSQGYRAGGLLSPGELDWPIEEQGQLFQLVDSEQIGVHLTPVGMMVPLKAVSLVIGIGPEIPNWTRAEICACCTRGKTCPYSKVPN